MKYACHCFPRPQDDILMCLNLFAQIPKISSLQLCNNKKH